MLETKYFKDMNHNYLIIRGIDKPVMGSYQLKMIIENDIPGLLNVSQRYIDGDIFFYYEVNSLQTLQLMYEHQKIDKKMAVCLLKGLIMILKEIKKYLLSDEGLLLKPEFIFLNWEKEEIFFIFYPYQNETAPEQMKKLFEYLVRVIDHQDEKLTDKIYDLCKLAERKMLSAAELDRHLLELTLLPAEYTEYVHNEEIVNDIIQAESNESLTDEGKSNSYTIPVNTSLNQDDEKKQRRKYLILSMISAAGAIFTYFYQRYFVLHDRELILSLILIIVSLVFFLLTGFIYIMLCFRLKSFKQKEKPEDNKYIFHIESDQNKPLINNNDTDYCGDTIFLSEDIKENKLYGIGKVNKHIINLIDFPFTIGKLADNTDFCLKATSISRIHVRFTKYDNNIFMTDLNSTNGTYRNGLRLEPSETVPIEAGDEIRLGKLNFYYR